VIDKRKIIRDSLVVVILIVVGYFLVRSHQPGPVEKGAATSPHGADMQSMPANHGNMPPELSEGEPVATLAAGTIGKTWFDDRVQRTLEMLSSQDQFKGQMDDATAMSVAQQEAIVEGAVELIETQAIIDMGIQPDMEVVGKQQKDFDSSPDAKSMMESMGLTREKLEALWKDESQHTVLRDKIAQLAGAEPASEAADNAYIAWAEKKLLEIEITFTDPLYQNLFKEYLSMMQNPESTQTSGSQTESLGLPPEPVSKPTGN
jgi:hypothetical protein